MSDVQVLHDALTGYDCNTYDDIATITGWDVGRVSNVLAYVRRADVARQLGWVVPHVSRGTADHTYTVLHIDKSTGLMTPLERAYIMEGALSTVKTIAHMGVNEAFVLPIAAAVCDLPSAARELRSIARVIDGAAAMAEGVVPKLTVTAQQARAATP